MESTMLVLHRGAVPSHFHLIPSLSVPNTRIQFIYDVCKVFGFFALSPANFMVCSPPNLGHFMTSSSPSLHLSVYTSYLDGHRAFILTSQAVIRRLGLRLSKSPSGLLTAAVGLWASSSHFIFADKVILPSLHCARDQ